MITVQLIFNYYLLPNKAVLYNVVFCFVCLTKLEKKNKETCSTASTADTGNSIAGPYHQRRRRRYMWQLDIVWQLEAI